MNLQTFLESIGINIGIAVAGFFGSLTTMQKQKRKHLGQAFLSLLSGTACATYLTPLAIQLIPVEGVDYPIAFVLGFMGLRSVEYFADKYFNVDDERDQRPD